MSVSEDFKFLVERGLSATLREKEISKACRGWLRDEIGCKPPLNHGLYMCMLWAIDLGQQAIGSRMLEKLENDARFGKLLTFVANACRQTQHRNELKTKLVEDFNAGLKPGQEAIEESVPDDVIQQLRAGQRLDGMENSLSSLLEDLSELHANVRKALDSIVINWDRLPHGDATASSAVRYNSEVFPIVGREREFDILNRFLGDTSNRGKDGLFKWLCITGPGGEGKTRLLYEFVGERMPFHWIGGKFDQFDSMLDGNLWQPCAPTLLVIDYPAQSPSKVGKVLDHLRKRANLEAQSPQRLNHPVRVVLLERSGEGPWMDEMLVSSSDGTALQQSVFNSSEWQYGMPLSPLTMPATIELMAARFRRAGLQPPTPEILEDAVTRIDSRRHYLSDEALSNLHKYLENTRSNTVPTPRPLFAAAVAELAVRAIEDGTVDLNDPFEHIEKTDLFDRLLRDNRKKHWFRRSKISEEIQYLHENALAAATFMRGLDRSQIAAFKDCEAWLPRLRPGQGNRWSTELIAAMGGAQDGSKLRGLEPDLLGEFHMLQQIRSIDDHADRAAFCAACLHAGGEAAQVTIILANRDYPDEVAKLDFLAPTASGNTLSALRWMEASKQLVFDTAKNRRFDLVQPILDRAAILQSSFPHDEAVALKALQVLTSAIRTLGAHQKWP
ncbi:ATP-binding protein, partial [Henriciella litoralis]|uniref:ATP-binding protein n=1 Tax=Henriciella litoralis TaxID=568102 RepID=UPI00146EE7FB